jgi:hypothetical protein
VAQVTDVTSDGTWIRVATSLNGFPPAPRYGGTELAITSYPALAETFSNTTIAGVPLISNGQPARGYAQNTVTGSSSGQSPKSFGTAVSITFNATTPYAGTSNVNFNFNGPFVIGPDG